MMTCRKCGLAHDEGLGKYGCPNYLSTRTSYYAGKIKVVGCDLMCWPVDPITLEATASSCYDAYAWADHEAGPIETISEGEWHRRSSEAQDANRRR